MLNLVIVKMKQELKFGYCRDEMIINVDHSECST